MATLLAWQPAAMHQDSTGITNNGYGNATDILIHKLLLFWLFNTLGPSVVCLLSVVTNYGSFSAKACVEQQHLFCVNGTVQSLWNETITNSLVNIC